jgi:hypothetical protein
MKWDALTGITSVPTPGRIIGTEGGKLVFLCSDDGSGWHLKVVSVDTDLNHLQRQPSEPPANLRVPTTDPRMGAVQNHITMETGNRGSNPYARATAAEHTNHLIECGGGNRCHQHGVCPANVL